jgi:hypothetical protein
VQPIGPAPVAPGVHCSGPLQPHESQVFVHQLCPTATEQPGAPGVGAAVLRSRDETGKRLLITPSALVHTSVVQLVRSAPPITDPPGQSAARGRFVHVPPLQKVYGAGDPVVADGAALVGPPVAVVVAPVAGLWTRADGDA